jgi:hypothetical protein
MDAVSKSVNVHLRRSDAAAVTGRSRDRRIRDEAVTHHLFSSEISWISLES